MGTENNVYIIRCYNVNDNPAFWRYDSTTNSWDSMDTSALPTGAFRNGASLAWDYDDSIYALLGGRYSDSNCRLFYWYSMSSNSWEQLTDTPHAQGAGDAITWSGYDDQIYALLGSKEHETDFACYNISTNSWTTLSFNPSWTTTDDGASLVWTGGEYLYALRGEWQETVPCQDFARYHILSKAWEYMSPIPESEGVGDGGSLLWIDECPDYIFALGGGSCLEDPGYNFYRYSISGNSWEELESLPCPVGNYVGNRLGFANGYIYYWQGAPGTWICGGDAFYMFNPLPTPTLTPPPTLTPTPTPSPTPSPTPIPTSTPCFIATAVYGTPLHEDIAVLRDFRDEYLMTNPIGRTFVKLYYTTSPPIADVIREDEGLRIIVREGLVKPLVHISKLFVG